MINIDFLYYIVEFSKTENLTKASEKLLISQSALTRAMKKLEEYVNVPLFIRNRNKITLNETGKEFVKYAQKVLEAEKQMVDEAISFHHRISNISIGYTAIAPIIKYERTIQQIFSDKGILLKEEGCSNLLKGLLSGVYDFVFINEEIETEDIVSVFVFTEQLCASFPSEHALARKEKINFSDIDGLTFLISNNIGIWRDIIDKCMPNSKFMVQRFEDLAELIEASVIPNFSTNITIPICKNDKRVDVPIMDKEATIDFYMAFRKKDKKKFFNLLKILNKLS